MIHELKIAPTHFDAWLRGEKTFELRRDDREPKFAAGDLLLLKEWDDAPLYRQLLVRVRSVLRDFEGLQPGYAILACTLVENLTPAGRAP